jgi:Carboxypeptidase regulatory-like domain/Bacterial Ig-like domain (group 2)
MRMCRQATSRFAYVIALVAFGGACHEPTTPSVVPRSVTVTAVPTGSQYQLSAVAGFSDGSTQDVTSQATWSSSDTTVAIVASTGLVTPVANGSALITASYQSVSGSMALTVAAPSIPPPGPAPPPPGPPAQTYTLSGVLRATPLNESVSGANVEAMHGGRVVATATTDGRGLYVLTGLIAQEYVLSMRKVGYYARSVDVLVSGDTTRDLVMDRNRVALMGIVREATPCFGAAINAALVQILDGPDAGRSSLTDRSGSQYEIPGVAWGTFRLRASKEGYATSDVTVTVPASDIVNGPFTKNIDLPRTARQALFGEVRERRAEHAAQIPGARIEVITGPDAGRATVSDSLGRYRLEQLTTGDVTLRATNPGYFDEVVTTQLCRDVQLEIRLMPTNARLEGTVFDITSGLVPIEGATVEVVSGSGAGQRVLTDAAGHYAFSALYETQVVRASKTGYTPEERTISIRDPVSFWNFGLRRP